MNSVALKSTVYAMGQQSTTHGYYLLSVCTLIAYLYELAGFAVPGQSTQRSPLRILMHFLGLLLLLKLYPMITGFISSSCASLGDSVGQNSVQTLWQGFQSAMKDENQEFSIMNLNMGVIGGFLAMISCMIVLVVSYAFNIVQGVLYGIIVAVGPMAISVSILPGASGKISGWIHHLVEIASWPIFLGLIFRMLTANGTESFKSAGGDHWNWVVVIAKNITLVLCTLSVPVIAAKIVGSGIGSLTPMLMPTSVAAPLPAAIASAASGSLAGAGAAYGRGGVLNHSQAAVSAGSLTVSGQPRSDLSYTPQGSL